MALPVILVDSATGSDTAASGAGPSTALTGTAGATDVAGTTVTLDAGIDLSGVATDGSHAIYMNNTTAGQRRFAKITGTAGSGGATPTVTVAEAYTGSLSGKTWAIGGKRFSIGAASSKVLFDNNGAAGDAMPGWIIELQSGHSETITATLDCRRSGSNSRGPITLRGVAGAATLPLITFSNNGNGLVSRGVGQVFQDFELRNSHGTKSASIAITSGTGAGFTALRLTIAASGSSRFWKGLSMGLGPCSAIECEIAYTESNGVTVADASHAIIRDNYIHDCVGAGLICSTSGTGASGEIVGNRIINNTGDGANYAIGPYSTLTAAVLIVRQNTIAGNGGDGFELNMALNNAPWYHAAFENNIFANNGGYGLKFTNASATAEALAFYMVQIRNNAFYSNTSGAISPSGADVDSATLSESPFVDLASNDVRLNAAVSGGNLCRAAGVKGYSDIGAIQRGIAARTTFVLGL